MAVQDNGLILLAQDEENYFLLRDAGYGLVDDLERFERLRRGMQLSDAAVDQNQAGHFSFLFLKTAIAARDGFAHAGKIVVEARQNPIAAAVIAANDEFAVLGFLH